MASLLKIVRLRYQTNLDARTCHERMGSEYLEKLRKEKSNLLYVKTRWAVFFSTKKKSGETKIDCHNGMFVCSFSVRLNTDLFKTIITVTTNPLGVIALLPIVTIIMFLASLIILHPANYLSVILGALFCVFFFYIPFYVIAFSYSYFAREIVIDYLEKALEARPVDSIKLNKSQKEGEAYTDIPHKTPGWYPNQTGDTAKLYWWNGTTWTDSTCDICPQPNLGTWAPPNADELISEEFLKRKNQ